MEKSLVTPEEGFIFNCTVIEPEFGDEDFKVLVLKVLPNEVYVLLEPLHFQKAMPRKFQALKDMFAESDNADSTVDEVFEDLSESLHEEIVIYNVKDGKYETCLGFEIQFIEKMPA
jgi:hypothetical protein